MTIRLQDITLADVQLGRNWLLSRTLKNWRVEQVEREPVFTVGIEFTPSDYVLYSALLARSSGRVTGLLMFKEVGSVELGGMYWEYDGGRWRPLGEQADPNFDTNCEEFVADPLSIDPSFEADDHDLRAHLRKGFRLHAHRLTWGSLQ